MSRIAHGLAAAALIAVAAVSLIGITPAAADRASDSAQTASGSACTSIVCMVAIN